MAGEEFRSLESSLEATFRYRVYLALLPLEVSDEGEDADIPTPTRIQEGRKLNTNLCSQNKKGKKMRWVGGIGEYSRQRGVELSRKRKGRSCVASVLGEYRRG